MTVSLSDLTRTFLRIGCLSFGGPAAQIAMMHREVVDERRWLEEKDYLSALSFCMLLPGPEAMQLATWIGWRLHGTLGGLISGLLFVLPGAFVVLGLSIIFATLGDVPLVSALFFGIQAAVVVVVIEALLRVAKRALKGRMQWAIAALAFLGLFVFNLPFPLIITVAGLWGYIASRGKTAPPVPAAPAALATSFRAILIWGAVWLLPLGLLFWLEGGLLADLGAFFSKLAVLTFGGAYAVLAWMTQEVVQDRAWLTLPEMMTGLGLAETTPGPLILVTQFVGFLAAFKAAGLWYGIAGAVTALWMTFAPCFLWIFAGAPWVARLTAMPRLSGALSGIMAAVVGVIANLSLWFAAHVFFATINQINAGPVDMIWPSLSTLNLPAVMIAIVSGWLLLFRHWNLISVLGVAALGGAATLLI
jgi:chromate transporter